MITLPHGRKRRYLAGSTAIVGAAAALGAFALTGTADAASGSPSGADRDHGPKPTVILEHGAFADASSWDGVITGLHPERLSYGSFASFEDPDGNQWFLQEISQRAPGR